MMNKSFKIIIICLILFTAIGFASAADDLYDANSTDILKAVDNTDIDDNLNSADDYDDLQVSNLNDKVEKDSSHNSDLLKACDEEESANWTELRNTLHSGNSVNLTKNYYFKTVWTGSHSTGSRSIDFYNDANIVIDGQGHTIDFTSDRLDEGVKSGGRIDLNNCKDIVFKNIHFINIEMNNHKSNGTTFINCTFNNMDMLVFQCSDSIKFYNCTINISEERYGHLSFGPKGWWDGSKDYMGGSYNEIINCTFINMKSESGCGGAMFFYGGNNLIKDSNFINCTISSTDPNRAKGKNWFVSESDSLFQEKGAGAINIAGPNNMIIGCNFTNCWSKYGGGIVYFAHGNNTVEDCNFVMDENLADYAKTNTSENGAIRFDGEEENKIINSNFTNFHNCDCLIDSNTSVTVTGSSFTNNSGSKIFDLKNTSVITDSRFEGNTAENGGALYISNSTVRNCTFINNHANGSGGAIYYGGGCLIDNCTFINNSAVHGGAISCNGTSNNIINNSRFINNTADESGGAITLGSTENSHVYNSYFENNTAKNGTAIYIGNNGGTENIENSTFVLSKEDCEIKLIVDLYNGTITVQFMPPDNYILGVGIFNSDVNEENLSYIVEGKTFRIDDPSIDSPLINKNIVLEFYNEKDELIANVSGFTDEKGLITFDAALLFSDSNPATYLKAYHFEDKYFKYTDDYSTPEVGDFDKLQYLVNKAGHNGVVELTRDYVYSLGLDTITEGVEIKYENLTIDGKGHSINALYKSRIFNIFGNSSRLVNVTFLNAVENAVYYNDVASAEIDNVKFINTNTQSGTVFFRGNNLTINNTEFINSTTLHKEEKYGFGEVDKYTGNSELYADSYDTVIISNTCFANSTFGESALNIYAYKVVLDNVKFADNIARYNYNYYQKSYYSSYYKKWVDAVNKTEIYEGYHQDHPMVIVSINAYEVEMSNVSSKNGTVSRFADINAYNSIISNISIKESHINNVLKIKGDSTIDGVDIENLSSVFRYHKYDNVKGTSTHNINCDSITLISIDNGWEDYEYDEEENDWKDITELYSNVSISNITIKNTLESRGFYVIEGLVENLTVENVDISDVKQKYLTLDGDTNEFKEYLSSFYITMRLRVNNTVISDVNVNNIECFGFNGLSLNAYCNVTVKDILMKNILMYDYYNMISLYGNGDGTNNFFLIDNAEFENIRVGDYDTSKLAYYSSNRGVCLIDVSQNNANITNIKATGCDLYNPFTSNVNTLNIENVSITDSDIAGYDNSNMMSLSALNGISLKNILIDGIDISKYVGGDDSSYNGNPGLNIFSNHGNVNLYNVNLTNSKTVGEYYLIAVDAYGNITFDKVNIDNISSFEKVIVNNGNETRFEGVFSTAIALLSQTANINLSDVSINNIETGIGGPENHNKYFMNITGAKIDIDGLSINNAAIGGLEGGKAVDINGSEVNINNFVFTNITAAVGYKYTYYNETLWKNIYNSTSFNGNAGIFINADKNATLTNINITNTVGGAEDGSLVIDGGNVTLKDILIEDIKTSQGLSVYYDYDLGKYITQSNSGISSVGISVYADEAVLDTVRIINSEHGSDFEGENYLIYLSANNANVSNIDVINITEKATEFYQFDEDVKGSRRYMESGQLENKLEFKTENKLNLYNLTVDNVENNYDTFMNVEGDDITIENVSITDSYLSSMGYTVYVDGKNVSVKNFAADNIYGPLVQNSTDYVDYYDKNGNFRFTNSYYECDSEAYFGFCIYIESKNTDISYVNITNAYGASSGNLYIYAENITADNILIENITVPVGFKESFVEELQKYVTEHSSGYYGGGLQISGSGGNIILSNVKLNNLSAVMSSIFYVENDNVAMENVTVTNIAHKPTVEYEFVNGEEIVYMEDYENFELIYIHADTENGVVNITNFIVDNVPCNDKSFNIHGKNITISKSVFRNMISESGVKEYNESTGKLEWYSYENEGNGVLVYGEYISISDTLFDNITVGSGEGSGNALVIGKPWRVNHNSAVITNCTFTNIHSVQGNETRGSQTTLYDSKGSAINSDDANSIVIRNSHFINSTSQYGGALYLLNSTDIINSEFINCSARYGGALYFDKNAENITVTNSNFTENRAKINGGAIYLFETSGNKNTIKDSVFLKNHANHDGGAFFYNNTYNKIFFCDYQWFNRTAMFADGLLSYTQPKTFILNSEFENNTDHEMKVIAQNVSEEDDQTIVITLPADATGKVTVNVTDENGNNIIDNSEYELVNGTVTVNLGKLPLGRYNVSVIHNNYNSNYDDYQDYAYHINMTSFEVFGYMLNVTVNETIFADENLTVNVKLNETATGFVDISVSNATHNVTFTNIPVVNGAVQYNITGLEEGNYNLTVRFNTKTNTTQLSVLKRDSQMDVKVEGNVYGNTTQISVSVPQNQTGNVTVEINGKKIIKEAVNGEAIFKFENLTADEYIANITFNENRIYYENSTLFRFNVTKANLTDCVKAQNITIYDDENITISVPDDFKGNITVKIGETVYYNGPAKNTVNLGRLKQGRYTVNVAFYGDTNYADNTIDADFEVKAYDSVMTVNINDVVYGKNATAIVKVSGNANGTVNIAVDGKSYIGEVVNGEATLMLDNVSAGFKSADVKFITSDLYNSNTTATASFSVTKANATLTIKNQTKDVIINLPEDAEGNVTLYVNGEQYSCEIKKGVVTVENVLKDGENTVVAIWNGDNNYNSASNSTKIGTVTDKRNSTLKITDKSGDVIIELPEDAEGNVTFYINGVRYNRTIENGKVNITDFITEGDNSIVAFWKGDDTYNSAINSTQITVEKPLKENATIKITNESRNVIITFPADAKGNATVYVNGEAKSYEIKNGNITIENVLRDGNNSIVVVWKGDEKYNETSNSTVVALPLPESPSKLFNITVTDLIAENAKVIVNVTGEGEGDVTVSVDNGTAQSKALTKGEAVFDLTGLSTDRHEIVVTTPDGAVSKMVIDAKKGSGQFEITTIKAENMTRGYGSPYDYQAAFLDNDGNALVNAEVKFTVAGKEYIVRTNGDGIAQLNTTLAVGKYNVTSINPVTAESITKELEIVKRIIENKDMKMDYTDGSKFTVKVIGDDGNIAPEGSIISITANGVSYVAVVDSKGYASLKINLLPKTYKVVCEFNGYKTTNKLVVKQILKPVKKTIKVKKSKKSFKIKATLKWSNKKPIKGKKITFKIKGKTLKAKSNKKGVATVKVKKSLMKKLKKGKTYTVIITYAVKVKYGDAYQTISDTVKCKVKIK